MDNNFLLIYLEYIEFLILKWLVYFLSDIYSFEIAYIFFYFHCYLSLAFNEPL
ncbi:hypothetical protein NEF87_002742 [Candidatus Lokiarchaeum ossiferum]|uniref:Uncharacterized protein n=1 Tax=Candidatus Lokiarchaeum ossiferum TaxID=2951803 RepID=A0ABY6HSG4_9ARCH|nr:hypothetical protein NEF87_002742 [Candidatus Lokiarchaeum sp. B-35]